MRLTFILLLFIFSCSTDRSNPEVPFKPVQDRIVAVYVNPESHQRVIDIIARQIRKNIIYDSVNKKDIIKLDTIYGYAVYVPLVDSLGKPVLDSLTHKPKINPTPQYALINSDSVNWRIQGISVDSLLKK